MVKVKVNTTFHDKNNFGVVYAAGQVFDFEDSRAGELMELGLVEKFKEEKKAKAEKKKSKE